MIDSKDSENFDSLNYFNFDGYAFISYKKYIETSEVNIEILNQFDKYDPEDEEKSKHYSSKTPDDIYGIAFDLYSNADDDTALDIKMSFNEFYRRFCVLIKNDYIVLSFFVDVDVDRDFDGSWVSIPFPTTAITKK